MGSQLSIADILLFDIVDLFLRAYDEQVGAGWLAQCSAVLSGMARAGAN